MNGQHTSKIPIILEKLPANNCHENNYGSAIFYKSGLWIFHIMVNIFNGLDNYREESQSSRYLIIDFLCFINSNNTRKWIRFWIFHMSYQFVLWILPFWNILIWWRARMHCIWTYQWALEARNWIWKLYLIQKNTDNCKFHGQGDCLI